MIQDAEENDELNDVQGLIKEFYDGLSHMKHQRTGAQGRLIAGRIGSLEPNYRMMLNWLQDPSTSLTDSERLGAIQFLAKGEFYG